MSEEQIEELRQVAKPLMDWLARNFHPHAMAIVDSEKVEIAEGLAIVRRDSK